MGLRIPKLPKAREVNEWDRQVPLKVKNANPFTYGFPSAISIPGNKDGIVVPCAPFDDFDGDRRWCICESKEQAIKLLDSYIRDWQKQDEESRCVFYKKKADGSFIGIKCRKNCLHCPRLVDPNNPDLPTWNYKREGKPESLDYVFDPDDDEESEHDIPDTEGETPEQYVERLENERIFEELISQRDEIDRKIIELLLDDNTLSERAISSELKLSKTATHYRLTKLREWAKTIVKK